MLRIRLRSVVTHEPADDPGPQIAEIRPGGKVRNRRLHRADVRAQLAYNRFDYSKSS